jgi:hypothetical protein
MKKLLLGIVIVVVACGLGFAAIQVIPYGKAHTNPPVVSEPKWDSPNTRELAQRACFDCHSNETGWPWYSSIAPVSWLVQHDVDEGRGRLNFSDWQRYAGSESAGEAAEAVQRGSMPPAIYLVQHPASTLSEAEKAQLIQGLNASLR